MKKLLLRPLLLVALVINPAAAESETNGITGTTSRRQATAPRRHQKITSHTKGSVTMEVLVSSPERNSPMARA